MRCTTAGRSVALALACALVAAAASADGSFEGASTEARWQLENPKKAKEIGRISVDLDFAVYELQNHTHYLYFHTEARIDGQPVKGVRTDVQITLIKFADGIAVGSQTVRLTFRTKKTGWGSAQWSATFLERGFDYRLAGDLRQRGNKLVDQFGLEVGIKQFVPCESSATVSCARQDRFSLRVVFPQGPGQVFEPRSGADFATFFFPGQSVDVRVGMVDLCAQLGVFVAQIDANRNAAFRVVVNDTQYGHRRSLSIKASQRPQMDMFLGTCGN